MIQLKLPFIDISIDLNRFIFTLYSKVNDLDSEFFHIVWIVKIEEKSFFKSSHLQISLFFANDTLLAVEQGRSLSSHTCFDTRPRFCGLIRTTAPFPSLLCHA